MSRLVILNATLYDGSGQPPCLADIAVDPPFIIDIAPAGTLATGGAAVVLDAAGLAVAPGFIDVHGHSDTMLIRNPCAHAKLLQGVTTEITGNCGCSKCIEVMPKWDCVADYARAVRAARPAINSATLAGHNSLRERVMGYENRPATQAEMQAMRDLLARALDEGACGLSSGLWYLPGRYAPTEEIVGLGACLRGTGKVYATHMRSEGDGLFEAIEEALAVARAGDGRLQVSHIKAAPRQNWHKLPALLRIIEDARAAGLQVHADRYPYIYSCTGLRMILPEPWNSIPDIQACLQDPAQAAQAAAALDGTLDDEQDWRRVIVTDSADCHRPYLGMTLHDIAAAMGLTPGQATVRLLAEARPNAAFGKMSEDNLKVILRQPWVAAGSDADAYPTDYSCGRAHPRAFGTFPRFIRMAREQGVPLADVIRRLTALPADIFGLDRRGRLATGHYADLVVFDERTFSDRATFAEPHRPAVGVRAVLVNGGLAYSAARPEAIGRHGDFLAVPNRG